MKKYLVNSAIFILIMGLFIISGYDKSELQTKEVKKQEATPLSLAVVNNILQQK